MLSNIDNTTGAFSAKFYNSLDEVDEVDDFLKKQSFYATPMRDLRKIFQRHKMDGFVGLCLLHNHNFIRIDEAMVQSPVGECLVTSPRKVRGRNFRKSVPWSFAAPTHPQLPLIPIEFSDDPLVRADYDQLISQVDFIEEFRGFVTSKALNKHVGLALLRREYTFATNSDVLVETVEASKRRNVLQWKQLSEFDVTKMIQTIYSLSNDDAVLTTVCAVRCINSSYCVQRSPGHARETSHGRQHRKETIT
ncbi:hypothetical protein ACVI3U_002853 [Sinorhizobium medicae]